MANWRQNLAGSLLNEAYKDQAEKVHKARLAEALKNQMKFSTFQDDIRDFNVADERKYQEGVSESEAKTKAQQDQIDFAQQLYGNVLGQGDKLVNPSGVLGNINTKTGDINPLDLQYKPDSMDEWRRFQMSQYKDEQKGKKNQPLFDKYQKGIKEYVYTISPEGGGTVDWATESRLRDEVNKDAKKLREQGYDVPDVGQWLEGFNERKRAINEKASELLGQKKETPPTAQRQRATNPKTGEVVEWDGKAWVPVK